ncbi:MAG TPA: HAMP domain-containing sensor histidine kinase [Kofleriaceae bacterium]|nr:HAMP domain-containing sensor histidine kinase [Kofleriaceae bacterium]
MGAPFAAFAILLVGLIAAHRMSARADDRAISWSRHAVVIEEIDSLATELVYLASSETVAGAGHGAHGNLAQVEGELARARSESRELARTFSVEEQRDERDLEALLDELMTRATEVRANPERGAALRTFFISSVVPRLHQRVADETHGSASSAASAQAVQMWADRVAVAVAFLILIVGLAICFRVARRFADRIAELERRARRVTTGDLEPVPHVESADELGQLARSIDEMVEILRQQRHDQFAFLASVAHDFRGSLSIIQLTADRLLQVPVEDREALQHSLAMVKRAVGRLARLANDIIDASRIEAGEFQLQRELVDVRTIARDVADQYATVSPNHTLHVSVSDAEVMVLADPTRLAQVLENLIGNAIKYSPDGGPIEIEARQDRVDAVLSVTDRGEGIAQESLEKIFEPFRRVSNVPPGVGLGLAIARRLVDAHGGAIDVESIVGQGSTFRVRIPLARTGASEPREFKGDAAPTGA